MNKEHKQFGMERVRNELASCSAQRPRDVLETIMQKVHVFVKDAEQSDDLTMLVIRYTPQSFESVFTDTLVLKNDIREIGKLGDFQKSVYTKINLDTSLVNKLRLAVEEAVVNVIDYAYPIGKEGEITIRMMYNGQRLKILIIDAGVPFDPTAKERVDTTLSAEERQIGGLGILLVRELMDSINYEREEGKNILTLIKDLK